jgi:hypothetical protein
MCARDGIRVLWIGRQRRDLQRAARGPHEHRPICAAADALVYTRAAPAGRKFEYFKVPRIQPFEDRADEFWWKLSHML